MQPKKSKNTIETEETENSIPEEAALEGGTVAGEKRNSAFKFTLNPLFLQIIKKTVINTNREQIDKQHLAKISNINKNILYYYYCFKI